MTAPALAGHPAADPAIVEAIRARLAAVHPTPPPRVRVELVGTADAPSVRRTLTRAWQLIGQPIVVVTTPGMGDTGRAAADWAAEHACAEIGLEVRHTTEASYPHRIVVTAGDPLPWCGCVAPPCMRCLAQGDDVPPCAGCASPLCPDCAR